MYKINKQEAARLGVSSNIWRNPRHGVKHLLGLWWQERQQGRYLQNSRFLGVSGLTTYHYHRREIWEAINEGEPWLELDGENRGASA